VPESEVFVAFGHADGAGEVGVKYCGKAAALRDCHGYKSMEEPRCYPSQARFLFVLSAARRCGGDCDPNSGQKKEHLTFIGWVSALGLIPMDKIAQRSQANGVLGLCIAQCDLLGVSTAGKKLIRRRLPAGSSFAPWLDLGPIAPSPFALSPRPTDRCGCAAMSAGAMHD
jgi:hypothetical protein